MVSSLSQEPDFMVIMRLLVLLHGKSSQRLCQIGISRPFSQRIVVFR